MTITYSSSGSTHDHTGSLRKSGRTPRPQRSVSGVMLHTDLTQDFLLFLNGPGSSVINPLTRKQVSQVNSVPYRNRPADVVALLLRS